MLDFSDATAVESFLGRLCCGDTLTHECSTHFLTPDLIKQLQKRIQDDNTENTAKIIAELAKHKSCREFICDDCIITKLVGNLSSKNEEVIFQTCRALANLCYDFETAAEIVVSKGAIQLINDVLNTSKFETEKEKQIIIGASGLLCNLITDDCKNVNILPEALRSRLLGFIQCELDAGSVTIASHRIMTVFVNLAACTGDGAVFSTAVCQLAVGLLKVSKDPDFYNAALAHLGDACLDDAVKLRLAEAGLIDFLTNHVEELSLEDDWNLVGQVMTNIIAGEDALSYVIKHSNPKFLDRVTDWLNSGEYNRVVLAAKCMLNYACCEKNSREIVERCLHRPLLSAMSREDCDESMKYAVLGCLRNISIPVENKERLIDDGILGTLDSLTSLDIQVHVKLIFQLLNVWRKLIAAGPRVACHLGQNSEWIRRIVSWSEAGYPWIMDEAPRLLASLVVKSKDRKVINNLLDAKAFPEIIKLIPTEHVIMQIEAVNAIAVAAQFLLDSPRDFGTTLVSAKIGDIISTASASTKCIQLLDNILVLLDVLFKYDDVKIHLIETNTPETVAKAVTTHSEFSSLGPRADAVKKLLQ